MAHRKSGGKSKNLRDSNPKYLGIKLSDGSKAQTGSVIVRQRGTKVLPGKNVGLGKDHTLFALKNGVVKFRTKRQKRFDNKILQKRVVDVVA